MMSPPVVHPECHRSLDTRNYYDLKILSSLSWSTPGCVYEEGLLTCPTSPNQPLNPMKKGCFSLQWLSVFGTKLPEMGVDRNRITIPSQSGLWGFEWEIDTLPHGCKQFIYWAREFISISLLFNERATFPSTGLNDKHSIWIRWKAALRKPPLHTPPPLRSQINA